MRIARRLLGGIFILFLMASCAASTQGPTTWIDRPLNGTRVPLAPLIIQAHASDSEEISTLEFYVQDTLLASLPSSGRLGDASVEWAPSKPGVYLIGARAIDSRGNIGPLAVHEIVVGEMTEYPEEPVDEPRSEPGPAVEINPPEPPPALDIPEVTGGPSLTATKNANCRDGPGTAYEIRNALMKGEAARIEGRNVESSWLWIRREGWSRNCWISVAVVEIVGDISGLQIIASQPPPSSPSVGQPTSEPPPVIEILPSVIDNTPPVISSMSAWPESILKEEPGCESYARTTSIGGTVNDEGGLSSVVAQWSIGSSSGDVPMAHTGGGSYLAVIGPVSQTGTLTIIVVARDNGGNTGSSAPVTVQVLNCVE